MRCKFPSLVETTRKTRRHLLREPLLPIWPAAGPFVVVPFHPNSLRVKKGGPAYSLIFIHHHLSPARCDQRIVIRLVFSLFSKKGRNTNSHSLENRFLSFQFNGFNLRNKFIQKSTCQFTACVIIWKMRG